MRKINKIIIHHSDSNWGSRTVIDSWHKQRGWRCIGYSFVINNGYLTYQEFKNKQYKNYSDGLIEIGRDINIQGAHCRGYNSTSIGICLIGKIDFTIDQFFHLERLIKQLIRDYKITEIGGHKDYNNTACPCFDVIDFLEGCGLNEYIKRN